MSPVGSVGCTDIRRYLTLTLCELYGHECENKTQIVREREIDRKGFRSFFLTRFVEIMQGRCRTWTIIEGLGKIFFNYHTMMRLLFALSLSCSHQVGIHRPKWSKSSRLLASPMAVLSVMSKPVWSAGCFLLGFLPGGSRRGGRRPQVRVLATNEVHCDREESEKQAEELDDNQFEGLSNNLRNIQETRCAPSRHVVNGQFATASNNIARVQTRTPVPLIPLQVGIYPGREPGVVYYFGIIDVLQR